jgi:hypothetical protein
VGWRSLDTPFCSFVPLSCFDSAMVFFFSFSYSVQRQLGGRLQSDLICAGKDNGHAISVARWEGMEIGGYLRLGI